MPSTGDPRKDFLLQCLVARFSPGDAASASSPLVRSRLIGLTLQTTDSICVSLQGSDAAARFFEEGERVPLVAFTSESNVFIVVHS